MSVPFTTFGATKEIQKLEKTLARDQDARARAAAAWELGQLGSTESVPALAAAHAASARRGDVEQRRFRIRRPEGYCVTCAQPDRSSPSRSLRSYGATPSLGARHRSFAPRFSRPTGRRLSFSVSEERLPRSPATAGAGMYAVTADGQRFLVNSRIGGAPPPAPLIVVQHFDRELRAAVERDE